VFSGLRASFVKRQTFKSLNRCAPFKQFKPTSGLRVQSSNTLYPAAVKSILDFLDSEGSALKSRSQFGMRSFDAYFAFDLLDES
jgi:hypothetical protein